MKQKYASKKMSKCRIWTGNALKMGKMTRNQGLFGEALFFTTSHLVVLVIYKCVVVKTSILYFMPPPFVNRGSTTGKAGVYS